MEGGVVQWEVRGRKQIMPWINNNNNVFIYSFNDNNKKKKNKNENTLAEHTSYHSKQTVAIKAGTRPVETLFGFSRCRLCTLV